MRLAALLVATLALAACQWDPPHQGARDASVPPLEVTGYGDMRIGMSINDVVPANRAPLQISDREGCIEQGYRAPDGDTSI